MEKEIKPAHRVSVENFKLVSVSKSSLEKTFKEFDETINKLEKFLKKLEKQFGEVIWYIGTDILEAKINERFMFKKSGFMEITIKKNAELNAYFPNKKKAIKFSKALRKTLKKLKTSGKIKLYE